ncbi:MAG: tRNA (adenosine(37)-N6)-threonylcarbamoyltransferase complex transferase subunit TsaD [Gemmatimonadota bacterium]|nr:tRNA (adenosine(37)-N6)-threonylcarbamoyltransferase complex transferase subunit TsaD [Gemmatimonadota bacterium]
MTRVLGIETSCDETSAAVIDDTAGTPALRSLVILSQDVHRVFGGVVPEIASRAHLKAIVPVVREALSQACVGVTDIDAIAVTVEPGLVGALMVGLNYAKGLSIATRVPLVAVHHMEGHLFATSLEDARAEPPFTALLVSGGHTLLLDVPAWGRYRLLGATRDDAAGEAYDKVAKLLGLPYPGGRHVEALARDGDPSRFRFTRPMLQRNTQPGDSAYFDVSFSGLKTAVLNAVRGSDDLERDSPDIARGFQDALVETLVEKTARAVAMYSRDRIVLGGGVACNRTLVETMKVRVGPGVQVFAPSARLATDNAAMIARAGLFRYNQGERATLERAARAAAPLPGQS